MSNACDHCGQLITENGHVYSNDIWISRTLYLANGERSEPIGIVPDYLCICPDCETELFEAWNELVSKLFSMYGQ